jgi:hypothetical protein
MDFAMAVRAQKKTLIDLCSDFAPAPSISASGNAKVLIVFFNMMKFKRFLASEIAATFALSAFILDGHLMDFFPTTPNGLD